MAAPIVWLPTFEALDDAVVALPSGDPRSVAGFSVLAALQGAGEFYDAANTSALRARITDEDTEYAAQLATWRTAVTATHALADRVARLLEQRALDAATGRALDPRVAALADGTRYPLTPEDAAALAVPGGYDDEATATAGRVLATSGGSPVPIVRVTARAPGREGNRLEVAVEDDAVGTRFRLRVRLGGYVETWESLDMTARMTVDASGSLLVSEVLQVGVGRPATAAYAAMTGGAGRVQESLVERMDRARLLPATGAVEKVLLDAARAQLVDAWARKPLDPSGVAGTAGRLLADLERALSGAMTAAATMTTLLGALD